MKLWCECDSPRNCGDVYGEEENGVEYEYDVCDKCDKPIRATKRSTAIRKKMQEGFYSSFCGQMIETERLFDNVQNSGDLKKLAEHLRKFANDVDRVAGNWRVAYEKPGKVEVNKTVGAFVRYLLSLRQDAILTTGNATKYGDRIGKLGGVDVDMRDFAEGAVCVGDGVVALWFEE